MKTSIPKLAVLCGIALFYSNFVSAQDLSKIPLSPNLRSNLIPNASFEDSTRHTNRWSGTRQAFHRNIQNWTSPTGGSPDVLSTGYMHRMFPARPLVDLSAIQPHSDSVMLGIKTYGCGNSTLHCKEYLQVRLRRPLEPGTRYTFECWVHPLSTSIRVDYLQVALSDTIIDQPMNAGLLEFPTVAQTPSLLDLTPGRWHRVSATFVAPAHANYLLIGSFVPDEEMQVQVPMPNIGYGYYLLDDLALYPMPTTTEERIHLSSDILFEFDQAVLLGQAIPALEGILETLVAEPTRKAEIQGHTDNIGSAVYNLDLSRQRAEAVRAFFLERGIAPDRLHATGYGSEQPIQSNASAEGRQANRRVEVVLR